MIRPPEDTPIGPTDTPYLHFPATPYAPGTLIPACVRLRDPDGDVTEALAMLADALLDGHVAMDRDDLADLGLLEGGAASTTPCAQDIFTVFLSADKLALTQARLAPALEVLQLGRAIAAGDAMGLAPLPDLAQNEQRAAAARPIVAVIDDGIGFLNTRFCRRDLRANATARYRSRFHAIWLQAFQSIPVPAFGPPYVQMGQVLHRREIDALLAKGDRLEEAQAYRTLNSQLLEPGVHSSTEHSFTHGTHILDLAAGADPESGDPVQDWPLLAVQLPPEAVDNTAGTQLEPCLIDAVRWILRQAERINGKSPLIINISFATLAGPKDGSKPVEAVIKHLLERWQMRTGRIVRLVLAFGNARRNRQSARLDVEPGTAQSVDWCLQPDDFAPSYLELRTLVAADLARLSVTLAGPGGLAPQSLGPLPVNTRRGIVDAQGRQIGACYHIGPRPTAPGVVTPAYMALAMSPSAGESTLAPHGRWSLTFGATGPQALPLRVEVQRGDTAHGYRLNGRQSYLDHPEAHIWDAESCDYRNPGTGPITRAASHSSFATALSPCIYSVGAVRGDTLGPSPYSPDGADWTVTGPSLAALADRGMAARGVLASGTCSGSSYPLDGTSVAAAQTTRCFALAFDAGDLPAPTGVAEAAHLLSLYGQAGSATPARQGAGVLVTSAPLRV